MRAAVPVCTALGVVGGAIGALVGFYVWTARELARARDAALGRR